MLPSRASAAAVLVALTSIASASCSSSSATGTPGGGTTTATGAGGSGTGGAGGSGGAGGGAGAFTHKPAGCGYDVQMDATRGTAFAEGDTTLGGSPAPAHVRLGLGGGTKLGDAGYADPAHSAAFVWDTDTGTTASAVKYGASKDKLDQTLTGFSYELPGSVPTRIHRADACGLAPKTTYYYQVGGGPAGKEVWSDVKSFTTAAAPDPAGEVTIGVSGDSRDSLDVVWPLVQSRMAKAGVDFQLFSGDSILDLFPAGSESDYGKWFDGADKSGTLGTMWIAAVGGNHENLNVEWLGNHALPGAGPAQGLYASFDVGPAHVVLLDDEIIAVPSHIGFDPSMSKSVLDWLEADLTAAEGRRATVPWIVVTHHRGPLSTSNHSSDSDVQKVRDTLMPIYDKHHVDLDLNGHDHNYERSKAANGPGTAPVVAASEAKGTVYIVCAGAGASGYQKGGGDVPFRAFNAQFGDGTPYVGVYGLLKLSAKSLEWKAMGLKGGAGGPEADDVIDQTSWAK
jgi:hypothetical protein